MFGNQASSLTQQLIDAGMAHKQANALSQVVGQCRANVEHRGSVKMFGPLVLGGDRGPGIRGPNRVQLVDPRLGAMLLNGQPASYYLNGGNITGTPGFRRGTLDADLTRDGTATVTLVGGGTITVLGYFVKTGYKVPSGQRIGAIQDSNTEDYVAIVNDDCLVAA
jgi:hypothetical protein